MNILGKFANKIKPEINKRINLPMFQSLDFNVRLN